MSTRWAWLVVVPAMWGLTVHPAATAARPVVIGYLFPQERLLDPAAIAAEKLTHINYAFANIRDGQVVEGFARDADNFKVLAAVRRSHPHLKVLVSVGGWTWSKGFSDAVLTPERRQRFVQSAVVFVRRHDLDGFDVDWEYPGLPGDDNPHRPEDKANFTVVMAELRRALDADAAARGRKSLLTFAAGAFPAFIANTQMAKVQAVVDYVNLMTYDFRVASVDRIAGHHANLFDHPSDNKRRSADRAVQEFLASGVPKGKLVMGVPFYGRGWREVNPVADGLYQPGSAVEGDLTYGRLAAEVIGRDGFLRRWDATAQAPFLWNAGQRIFISYDDPESMRRKANYVRDKGLGGVMFWQYAEDPSGALLDALHSTLNPM